MEKKINIEIVDYKEQYINQAVELAIKEFYMEKESCPALPEEQLREQLTGVNTWLCGQQFGKVALHNGEVIGFLAFGGPWDGFHGKEKGVFSPVGGSAFLEETQSGIKREILAPLLLAAVTEELVQAGVYACAICRYAHDEKVGQSLILKGFGIRCSDAIRDLSEEISAKKDIEGVEFVELKPEEFKQMAHLKNKLTLHMSKAPIFYVEDLNDYKEWFTQDMRVFVAKMEDKMVGYISICEDGEAFLTEDEKMINVCGAYFEEECRGGGMAAALLAHVCSICKAKGYTAIGVDYETINPTALNFWTKYFTPYTYSYERRFDERMIEYRKEAETYFNNFML